MTKLKEIIFKDVQDINNKYLFLSKVETRVIYKRVTNGLKACDVLRMKDLVVEECQKKMIKARKKLQEAREGQILIVIR